MATPAVPSSSASRLLRFVDIGVNLTDPVFRGRYRGRQAHPDDFDQVLLRAKAVGMQTMIITGTTLSESRQAVALARKHNLFCTVGCHPTRCKEFLTKAASPEEYLRSLDELIEQNRDVVCAVGECGLDYDRLQFCPAEVQRRFFPLHFRLAAKHRLPLFLHERSTNGDFVRMMEEHRDILAQCGGAVVHCFGGPVTELEALLRLPGVDIGLCGCSLKQPRNLDVLRAVPLDRLHLETDAPWCDLRPTHASHALRFASVLAAAGGEGPKKLQDQVRRAAAVLPAEPPLVKHADRWHPGAMVKGRNEPCAITQMLEVLFTLRGDEVDFDVVRLSHVVADNSLRRFRITRETPSS